MNGGKKKITKFEKIHSGYIQIYINNIWKETKQNKKYLYIYKHNVDSANYETNKQLDEKKDIHIYESDDFPEYLVLSTRGYMFIKKGSKKKEIPILPEFPINEYKTNFIDFNNKFNKNLNTNTFIKLSPYISFGETHPKLIIEHDYLLYIDQNNHLQTNEILKQFKIKNEKIDINNSKQWFEYIKKNCPFNSIFNLPFNYYSEIDDNVFKKEPTINDVCIFYDIKSKNEYKIIQEIETTFEDKKQKVIFHETYNNKLNDVINKCNEMKIKYTKKNEYSIELKWSDLNKLGLKWTITDFI